MARYCSRGPSPTPSFPGSRELSFVDASLLSFPRSASGLKRTQESLYRIHLGLQRGLLIGHEEGRTRVECGRRRDERGTDASKMRDRGGSSTSILISSNTLILHTHKDWGRGLTRERRDIESETMRSTARRVSPFLRCEKDLRGVHKDGENHDLDEFPRQFYRFYVSRLVLFRSLCSAEGLPSSRLDVLVALLLVQFYFDIMDLNLHLKWSVPSVRRKEKRPRVIER